jgi:hypothetical protein
MWQDDERPRWPDLDEGCDITEAPTDDKDGLSFFGGIYQYESHHVCFHLISGSSGPSDKMTGTQDEQT